MNGPGSRDWHVESSRANPERIEEMMKKYLWVVHIGGLFFSLQMGQGYGKEWSVSLVLGALSILALWLLVRSPTGAQSQDPLGSSEQHGLRYEPSETRN